MENLEAVTTGSETAPVEQESLRDTITKAMTESATKETVQANEPALKTATTEATVKTERARDESGKFKAAEQAATMPDAAVKPDTTSNGATAPAIAAPPGGWSVASKAVFDTLPDTVKADITKREAEINQGFAKYSGLDRYVQEFEAAGVRLPDAVAAYRAAEQQLTNDFPTGIEGLCGQFGIHPVALAQHILQKYGQAPQGQQNGQVQVDPRLQQYIAGLEQKVNGIEQNLKSEKLNAVQTDIQKFIADPSNKFVDNVVDSMTDLIKVSRDKGTPISLKDAYDAACWLNPETRQLLINEQISATSKGAIDKASKAANQARAAAASVTGAPIHGVSPDGASRRSLRDEIKANMDASMGRV